MDRVGSVQFGQLLTFVGFPKLESEGLDAVWHGLTLVGGLVGGHPGVVYPCPSVEPMAWSTPGRVHRSAAAGTVRGGLRAVPASWELALPPWEPTLVRAQLQNRSTHRSSVIDIDGRIWESAPDDLI